MNGRVSCQCRWLLVGLVLVSCTKSPEDDGKKGPVAPPAKKRLVLALGSEPDTLNPMFAETAVAREVIFFGLRELTMHDDRWEIVPDLAERVPTTDNGDVSIFEAEDGHQKMRVIWHIKKTASWQDGVPVTAEDCVFAWNMQMDPTQEIINRDLPERIESMEVQGDDKKTLVVTWKEPFAFYHQWENHHCLPQHVLEPRYRKPGGGTANMKQDVFGQKPLANGPYLFKEWLPGQHIVLEKNPTYVPPAHIDEIVVRFMKDTSAIQAALIAGDIDGVLPSTPMTSSEIDAVMQNAPWVYRHHIAPGLVWAHIDFNLDDPILADKRVRQAIAHGINRKGILEKLYGGKYTIAHTFLPPRHWGYHPGVKTYPFDLDAAGKLLDEAGWAFKGEGKPRKKGRQKLILTLNSVAGIPDIRSMQAIMAADLAKIGVQLNLDNKNAKAFFGDILRYRKAPHMTFYSWSMDPTAWGNTLWQEDMIPSANNNWQGQNYPGWRNPKVSSILPRVPNEIDEKERTRMMHEVQEVYAEELPAVPVFFRPVEALAKEELVGFSPTGTQTPVAWNVATWDLVPAENTK